MSEKKKKTKDEQTEEIKVLAENKEKEIHELKKENENLEKELEDKKSEVGNLKKKIEDFEELLQNKNSEIDELKKLLETKNKNEEEIVSKLKYIQAEFENFRKRVQKEKEEFSKFCNEKLIISLIPIYEDLERALNSLKDLKNENFVSGIKMVYENFKSTLKKEGLEEIKTIGEKFNPYEHEALMQVVNNEVQEGTILQEVQRGYILSGKAIRVAKVIVSKRGDEIVKKEKAEIVKKEKEDLMEVKEKKENESGG